MSHSSEMNWKTNLATSVFIITSALIGYGYLFPSENNLVEAPSVLHLINPEIYQNDFFVREQVQIGPRYYYHLLIATLAKIGLTIPQAYFLCYVVAFSSFIFGLYSLGRRFGRSKLTSVSLSFLGLATTTGTIGFVDLFRTEPIPSVFAIGFTIWGIYFCFCKRWTLGYLFFGLAALLQFLVGVLPGAMMASLLILDARKKNNLKTAFYPFSILALFLSFVFVPMALSGNTNTTELSDKSFIDLYGIVRHPHHIIPSSWSSVNWRNFLLFELGGFLFIKNSPVLKKEDKFNLIVLVTTSIFLLFIGYLLVEIYPIAWVAKLQFGRTTPFAQLAILIGIATSIEQYYRNNKKILSLLLLLAPTLHNSAIYLLILAILLSIPNLERLTARFPVGLALLAGFILLDLSSVPSLPLDFIKQIFWKCVLLFSLTSPFILEEFLKTWQWKNLTIYSLALTSSLFAILGLLGVLPQQLLDSFQGRVKVYNETKSDIGKLALRFRKLSQEDALVLVPPSEYLFRFYSQRSVVFDFKGFPHTDTGIQEWASRMKAIVGKITPVKADIDRRYCSLSTSELVSLAQQFHADYILTRTDCQTGIDGTIVDREGLWIIYKLNNS
jgi:hypothetical protein